MKLALSILALVAYSALAYADGCTTSTMTINGRFIMCTTCCFNGNCNTTCN